MKLERLTLKRKIPKEMDGAYEKESAGMGWKTLFVLLWL